MANEFFYKVSLSIVHPTIDPKLITDMINDFRPRIEKMAGSEGRGVDGKPLIPNSIVELSHWLAELHDEDKLYSGDWPISDFILQQVVKLERHRNLFSQIINEGYVKLVVHWFPKSNYSAEVLNAEALKKCGDLGIDIELNYYGPSAA